MVQKNDESVLKQILSKSVLRSQAGSIYYSRGEEYFKDGNVRNLEIDTHSASAVVTGTHNYKVSLSAANGILRSSCNCPLGRDGEFCKHKVALGLACLNNAEKKKHKSVFHWKNFVKNCTREELEKIIFEMSPMCPDIIEKYRMENLPSAENVLKQELQSKIDQLAVLAEECGDYEDDYYDYENDTDADTEFLKDLKLLESAMRCLADKAQYKLLFEISEYGIEQIRETSTFQIEPVSDFLDLMLDFYVHSAASVETATPEHIVSKIWSWEDNNDYCSFGKLDSLFKDFPQTVKDLWYERALAEWRKLPVLKMGDSDRDRRRKRMEDRLMRIAAEKKEDSLLLEIMEHNLSEYRTVLALADEYRKRKMRDKILPLLKNAKNKFPNNREIRNALVKEQQKQGNTEDALRIAWHDFVESPLYEETFSFLKKVSKEAECETQYFEKALAFLAEYEKKKKSSYPCSFGMNPIRERRIEILLAARRYEDAWELGKDERISEGLMLRLLRWRSKEHPEEAATGCNVLIDRALEPVGNQAYEHVIALLKNYREYMTLAGKEAQFKQYCQWIKTEYLRRKNLIALLNKHHL